MKVDSKTTGLTLDGWQHVLTKDPRPIDDKVIVGVKSLVYEQDIGGVIWSMGQFFFGEQELFRAWGVKTDEHCSFHTIVSEDNFVHSGCPQYTLEETKEGYVLCLKGLQEKRIPLF